MELLKHDLHLLPIGRTHRDEVKTLQTSCISSIPAYYRALNDSYLCVLDLGRGAIFEEVRHLLSIAKYAQIADLVDWRSRLEVVGQLGYSLNRSKHQVTRGNSGDGRGGFEISFNV